MTLSTAPGAAAPPSISGFTVIRNAISMGYPVVASIRSILPIVEEYVVGVGQSDDATRTLIESIGDPKLRIFDSFWDPQRRSAGAILADKTNEALAQCRGEWCFYLQADEVVHERDLPAITRACAEYAADPRVEGLLFDYLHFYGSYSVIATARNWYRREVRVVRRAAGARSIGDAQSFSVGGRNPRVRHSGATIYHYGHAKPPRQMGEKHRQMAHWYRRDQRASAPGGFAYRQLYGLRRFLGSHPAVMKELVETQDWWFEPRLDPRHWKVKDYKNALSAVLERVLGRRIGERRKYELLG